MKMTSKSNLSFTSGGLILSLVLWLVCLVIIFVGGWHFQSSLVEEKVKTEAQGEAMEEFKETVKEQISQLQIQLEILENQLEIDLQASGKVGNSDDVTSRCKILYRRATANVYNCSEGVVVIKGKDGQDGLPGPPGPARHKRDTGAIEPGSGVSPESGDDGVVYVRWGHNSCPDTGAELVYSGRVGGSHFSHTGGGGNPECLPNDPEYFNTTFGEQTYGFMFGAEYERTNSLVDNSQDTDVVCAVCYVPTRNVVYMLPAKYTCPTGWTREYYGYLMSERNDHQRSTFSCVDYNLKAVISSSANHNGFLFYPVEGVCGSLSCPPYDRTSELSCAVCTK